jgi:membrane protease YdiL (CAAX protease family)
LFARLARRNATVRARLAHSTEESDVRQRWIEAALIFLILLLLIVAYAGCAFVLARLHNVSEVQAYGVVAIVCLLVYLVGARFIERRSVPEFSLSPALSEIVAGLLAGIALFAAVIFVLWLAGVYQPLGWGSLNGIGPAFVLWLAVGLLEEIQFRGLVYRLCGKIFGTWGAIVLSGILFGLIHGIDPGATATALSSVAMAGLLLGAAFALTGRLWLPIGIHAGWNFAEGSLFGTAVSGSTVRDSLSIAKLIGPDILTGGRFGPEASIVTVVVLFVATTFLVWRIAWLRRTEPPIWRAGKSEPAAVSP